MTTVTKNRLYDQKQMSGSTPDGNAVVLAFSLATNASGVMTDSDQTTALVQTNKVRFGILPAGMRLDDALSIVSDLFTAAVTLKVGFEYADGVDDTGVPQDDDYFHAALALSATGRTRANNLAVRPVVLAKDAYLIGTVGGADVNAAGQLDVLVFGEFIGIA
jgi:hypothetical protein